MTTPVQTAVNRTTGTSLVVSFSTQNVTPGNTLVLAITSTSAPTSVTESLSETVNTRVAWAGALQSSDSDYIAVYDVLNSAGNSKVSFTINVASSQNIVALLAEYPASVAASFDKATSVAFANNTSVATASLTPANSGELAVAVAVTNITGAPTWSNGYASVAQYNNVGGTAPALDMASQTLASTSPITAAATASANGWAAAQLLYSGTPVGPTVTSVNGGASITEGATGVAVVGTGFASGMTATVTQPGGVSVSQAFTYTNATNGTFNLTMEPGTGDQLAFTDATFTTDFQVTVSGSTSSGAAITLQPPAGLIFQTLGTINTNSAYTITATPALASGDQLEAAGNSAGTAAVPTGLTLNADGTYTFASGDTPTNFYVRAYDSTNKVWGAYALQTVSSGTGTTSAVYKNIYEVSPTGLVQWIHYIPIKYVTVTATEVNRFDDNGAIGVNVLSSVTGLTAWVDYTPVVQSSGTKQWSYDATGYVPVMRMN